MSIDRHQLINNHTLFPNSFLRSVKFKVGYPELAFEGFGDKLRSFLKNDFGINDDSDRDSLFEGVVLKSAESNMEFRFYRENALITINGKDYECFDKSLYPYTRPIYDFLANVVETDSIKSMTVSKNNQWLLATDDPKRDLHSGLKYIFREGRLKELPDFSNVSEQSIVNGFYTETSNAIPGSDLNSEIGLNIKYTSEKKLEFSIKISAKAENVALKDFIPKTYELNNLTYSIFVDLVSDEVLALMLSGDQK